MVVVIVSWVITDHAIVTSSREILVSWQRLIYTLISIVVYLLQGFSVS